MKIAVSFDNGQIFGHFGKTETFKIYEVDEEKVISSEVVASNAQGHSALADFLSSLGVDAVVCGNIGEQALSLLVGSGINVVSGASGDADSAIEAFLKGELSGGVNCPCGGDEEGGCGGCGGGCDGGGCGGCGGGCGGGMPEPLFEGPNVGKACVVHYHGTFDDGECFDSSFDRGEPIQFICGVGMMIPGFDKAVATMNKGDVVNIHLEPEEAYGQPNPNMILDLEISQLPGSEDLNVGDQVFLGNAMGQEFPVKVVEKTETKIKLDANHEMAGKSLNFKIELVDIIEA